MEQPQKGNLLAAEKINLADMNDQELAAYSLTVSDASGESARRTYKDMEAKREAHIAERKNLTEMTNGYVFSDTVYTPDSGADMVVGSPSSPERFAKLKKLKRAIGAAVLTMIALNAAPANAETPTTSVEQVEDESVNYYEQILGQAMQGAEAKDTEANHEAEQVWDIEYLTDSKDKRYEKNFGPSYEGDMDKASVVADILDRAKKDPAFLAAMTASCGAIEQGDVDACSLAYAGDFKQRQAAYEKLSDLLQDENTTMTHFVSEQTFSSTYFSGTTTEMVDGTEVTVPKIGYSTNQKVRAGADDRQKYVAKFVNAQQGLDTELRPDCGWQYNIVDEAKMAGVPQVTHELQQPTSVEAVTAGEVPVYTTIVPEVKSPIVEMPRVSLVTPEAPVVAPTLDKTPEESVVAPESEAPKESEKTPELAPQPVTPEDELEEEPAEPSPVKEIPVAPNPDEVINVPEVEKPDLPIAPTPELIVPIIPDKPTEPKKPDLPIAPTPELEIELKPDPTPEVTPPPVVEKPKPKPEVEPPVDDRKKFENAPKNKDVNPENVTIKKGEKPTIEKSNEGTTDGKSQSVREEAKIPAPKVETGNDAPIYDQMKREQEKAEALRKAAETEATKRQAAEQERQRKIQAETDRQAAEMEKKMAEQGAADKAAEEARLKIVEQERQKAAEQAEAQRQEAAKPSGPTGPTIKAPAPTETTNETNN